MALWLLEKGEKHFDYDVLLSCVVRAPNEAQAREQVAQKILHENDQFAHLTPNVEGAEEWRNPEIVTCKRVPFGGKYPNEIIHEHWHAG